MHSHPTSRRLCRFFRFLLLLLLLFIVSMFFNRFFCFFLLLSLIVNEGRLQKRRDGRWVVWVQLRRVSKSSETGQVIKIFYVVIYDKPISRYLLDITISSTKNIEKNWKELRYKIYHHPYHHHSRVVEWQFLVKDVILTYFKPRFRPNWGLVF